MKHTSAVACGIGLLLVSVALFAVSPDIAFWVYFALLVAAAPLIVVVGAIRWIVKRYKGGTRAR